MSEDNNKQDAPPTSSQNPNISEIDETTKESLRGDRIGETMFSETFVLKTLLKLQDIQWDKDLEDELAFLWDCTMEPEVSDYLLNALFPNISCSVIETSSEPRLIEILIGTLANILSNANTILSKQKFDQDLSVIVLKLLDSDDHLILIQVMRFIKALAFIKVNLDIVNLQKLDFILNNSRNLELLMITLDAVSKLTEANKVNSNELNGNLANSVLAAFECIGEQKSLSYRSDDYLLTKAASYCVSTIANLLSYENNRITSEIEPSSTKIVKFLFVMTFNSTLAHEDLPKVDIIEFILSSFNYICEFIDFRLEHIDDMLNVFLICDIKVSKKYSELCQELVVNFVLHLDVANFLEKYKLKNCRTESVKNLIEMINKIKAIECEYELYADKVNQIFDGVNTIFRNKESNVA